MLRFRCIRSSSESREEDSSTNRKNASRVRPSDKLKFFLLPCWWAGEYKRPSLAKCITEGIDARISFLIWSDLSFNPNSMNGKVSIGYKLHDTTHRLIQSEWIQSIQWDSFKAPLWLVTGDVNLMQLRVSDFCSVTFAVRTPSESDNQTRFDLDSQQDINDFRFESNHLMKSFANFKKRDAKMWIYPLDIKIQIRTEHVHVSSNRKRWNAFKSKGRWSHQSKNSKCLELSEIEKFEISLMYGASCMAVVLAPRWNSAENFWSQKPIETLLVLWFPSCETPKSMFVLDSVWFAS